MGCVQSNNACLRRCLTGAAMSVGIDEVVGLNLDILSRVGSLRGDQAEGAMKEPPHRIESADPGGSSFLQVHDNGDGRGTAAKKGVHRRGSRVRRTDPLKTAQNNKLKGVDVNLLNGILCAVLSGDYKGKSFKDVMRDIFAEEVCKRDPKLSGTIHLLLHAASSFLQILLGELREKVRVETDKKCLNGLIDLLKHVVELVDATGVLECLPKQLAEDVRKLLFEPSSEMTWKKVLTEIWDDSVRPRLSQMMTNSRSASKIFRQLHNAIASIAAHDQGRNVLPNIAGFDLLGLLTYVFGEPEAKTPQKQTDGLSSEVSKTTGQADKTVHEELLELLLETIAHFTNSVDHSLPEFESRLQGETVSFLVSVIATAARKVATLSLESDSVARWFNAFRDMARQFDAFFGAAGQFSKACGLLAETFLGPLLSGKSGADKKDTTIIRTQAEKISNAVRETLRDEKFWPLLGNLCVGLITPIGQMLFNTAFGKELLFPLQNFEKNQVTALLEFVSEGLRSGWQQIKVPDAGDIIGLFCDMSFSFVPPTEIVEAFIKGTRGVDHSSWKFMMIYALKTTIPIPVNQNLIARTTVSFAELLAATSFDILFALGPAKDPPLHEGNLNKVQLMAKALRVLMERYLSPTVPVAAAAGSRKHKVPEFDEVKRRWATVKPQSLGRAAEFKKLYTNDLPEKLQKWQRAARAHKDYVSAKQIAQVELDMFREQLHYFGDADHRPLLHDALQLGNEVDGTLYVFLRNILERKKLDQLLGDGLDLSSWYSVMPLSKMTSFVGSNLVRKLCQRTGIPMAGIQNPPTTSLDNFWSEFDKCKRVATQMLLFKRFEDSWSNEWEVNDEVTAKHLLKLWFVQFTPKPQTEPFALSMKEEAYEIWKQQPRAERDVFTWPPPQAVIDKFRRR